jgi:glycosyltransferase involved in cell wall biosynthesis
MNGALVAISRVTPWPVTDGHSLRVASLLEELAKSWDVTLVAPRRGAPDPPARLAEWIDFPLEGEPWSRSELSPVEGARLAALVSERARAVRPAALLAWTGTEQALLARPQAAPVVADRIDCLALMAWRDARVLRSPRAFLSRLSDVASFAASERRLVRAAGATTVVGEEDARWLRRIAGRPVHVVPNGVRVAATPALEQEAPEPTVVFTGVLTFPPNTEAACHFALHVWPRVVAAVPGARFVVAGRGPAPPELARLAGPDVAIEEDVDDMAALLRRAWLAVAPMRSGCGIKNKVLEAWAVGRPVVLTPLASNGLSLDDEARRWIAERPADLAERVIRLLRSGDQRRRAGEGARALAASRHTWEEAAARLSEVVLGLGRAGPGR